MARIVSSSVVFPGHDVTQSAMQAAMARWMRGHVADPDKVLRILQRSGVRHRQMVMPLAHLFDQPGFGDRNRAYIEHGTALGTEVATAALAAAALPPAAVDLVTSVSCTGFMIPSLDAHLANQLPLAAGVRRLPITELGCAGGAMALGHTADILRGAAGECALIVAVEIASLSLQREDFHMAHLVSCALFGDGAAALVLAGAESDLARRHPAAPRLVAHRSVFFHDTLGAMGFRVESTGFHMILDASIPELLRAHLPATLAAFLADHGLRDRDVEHFLVHPGGRRILDTAAELLGRGDDAVRHSRALLAEHGNLSSASILALFDRFARSGDARPGDRAVLIGFGPGFNAELLLVEWPRC